MIVNRASLRVAIIGGGPGGLLLARILQKKAFENVTVYEGDSSHNARDAGGTLDLKTATGQWGLKVAGLHDKFLAVCRPEGEDMRILDKLGKVHLEEISKSDKNNNNSPEIDRGELRQLLLDSLEPNTVRWGKRCSRVSRVAPDAETGPLVVDFADGESVQADLVVGADGAWSKTRSSMIDPTKPFYTGMTWIDLRILDAAKSQPEAAKLVGRGSMLALSDGKGLLAQFNGDGSIRVYAAMPVDESFPTTSTVARATPETKRQEILKTYDGWAPELRHLVEVADPTRISIRPLYSLPVGFRWAPCSGVTLLGDAAHLTTPNGDGANLAIEDAADLALCLDRAAEKGWDLSRAVARYEGEMFGRGKESAKDAEILLKLFFEDKEAPKGMMEFFKKFGSPTFLVGFMASEAVRKARLALRDIFW